LQPHQCEPSRAFGADDLVTGDQQAGLLSRQRLGNAGILTATVFCQD